MARLVELLLAGYTIDPAKWLPRGLRSKSRESSGDSVNH
jgi:hypothetical protein